MEKRMSHRGRIRAVAFLTAVILAVTAWAIYGAVRSARLSRQIEVSYQRSLSELDAYVNNIATGLSKGIYANTPTMMESMAANLSREATGAKGSLAVLPIGTPELQNTYKFLSQVGDFVLSLNRKAATGEKITDKERQELRALLDFSKTLSGQISAMRENITDGVMQFEKDRSTLMADKNEIRALGGEIEDTEQTFTEYPSLIYDGPFSDHINRMQPKFLEGKETVSKDTALKKAAYAMSMPESEVRFTGEEGSNTAAYCFAAGDMNIAITKKGGHVLYLLSAQYAGEEALKYEDAVKRAHEYLKKIGYTDLKESYHATNDGICTINFAHLEDDVTCYTDLIKVGVSMDTGKILSVDARGYVANHHARTLPVPKLSTEAARASVSPVLTVLSVKKALIPNDGKSEKLTYEFHCRDEKKQEVLVYIDAETGFEDDILLLTYSDGGVLTK